MWYRLIEATNGPGFLEKPAEPILIRRKGWRQDLDCDLSSDTGILGTVHLTHASRTQQCHDLVWADNGSR